MNMDDWESDIEDKPQKPLGTATTTVTPVAERTFDWGPPAADFSDRLKEWALYLAVGLLLIVGVWFLIDSQPGDSSNYEAELTEESTAPASDGKAGPISSGPIDNSISLSSKVSPTAAQLSKPIFHVQLGAFLDGETAKTTVEALKEKGFEAAIRSPDDQYEMYRVLMGPFESESEAESMSRKLNKLDFPCFVVESTNIQNGEEKAP